MKKFSLFLMTICFCTAIYANALKDLSELLATVHSASATFTQTTFDGQNQVLQSSTGIMRLSKPGYFWWEIKTPNRQLIAVRDGKVWWYQPDLKQLTVRPFNISETQTPATLLLNGNMDILNSQYTVHKEMDRQLVIFTLIPKADNQLLKSMVISFKGEKLVELDLADHLDHLTKASFEDFKLNPTITPSLYKFDIPKDTDVVYE